MGILLELVDDLEEGLNVGAIGDVQGVFAATFVCPVQEGMVQIDRGEVVERETGMKADGGVMDRKNFAGHVEG